MIKNDLKILKDIPDVGYSEDIPMSRHVTFRTGGNADIFLMPESASALSEAVKILSESAYPYYIIGNGSNLIVPDEGIRGAVISTKGLKGISVNGNVITAGSGVSNSEAARFAENCSLGGMEFLSGIPGSIGGAAVMNAGAYGHETKDILTKAVYMTKDGKLNEIPLQEINYGYRTSIFTGADYIVVEAEFSLYEKDKSEIASYTKDLNQRRRDKQPLNYPSAGSVFKRPEGHFAGKLIEDCGLKGYRIGGAMVSEKHAGFIINYENATSTDILNLIKHVQDVVWEQFGVKLEREIKILGSVE